MIIDMADCIFCKIARGDLPSDNVFESENILAFKDIHPKAPVHLLIIPKRHANTPDDLDSTELTEIFKTAANLAVKFGVKETGYRLLFNIGRDANQEIDHVHLHLIGGVQSGSMY